MTAKSNKSGRAERRRRSHARQQYTQTVHDNMREKLHIPKPKGYQWQERAACLTEDPELFFEADNADEVKAKDVCARCPVQAQCLSAHIFEPSGIFGGTNPKERDRLRKKGYKRASKK